MGFSRQEYWSGLPCLPPGDRPNPGIKPMSLLSPALAGEFFTTNATSVKQILFPFKEKEAIKEGFEIPSSRYPGSGLDSVALGILPAFSESQFFPPVEWEWETWIICVILILPERALSLARFSRFLETKGVASLLHRWRIH